MNIVNRALTLIGIVAVSGVFVYATYQNEESNSEKQQQETKVNDYNVYALDVPESLNFAGEEMPLYKQDIYERIDRELLVNTYWQSNGLLLIKRSKKYFPIIEPILEKYGVPNDFKYLAVIESGLTQAVSPAKATGFWQILKNTGRELGLEVNQNVDERYHVEKATEAACKYLLDSKQKMGSWTLAAAAYNAGNHGIQKYMDQQKVNNYYDLLLGQETGRYVFRIVAIKQILENASKYGFNFSDRHLYSLPETNLITVDTAVTDFPDFAKRFGLTYKDLKLHNPWLRERHLNNASRKVYEIKIPK